MKPFYPFDSEEELDAYNQRKVQEAEEHNAGYEEGGPIDETQSQAYQYGQSARMEADTEKKPWWKLW